jgi:hypothetical protein
MRSGCDNLQLNGLVGIVLAGAGLALAASRPAKTMAARAAIAIGVGAVAAIAALAMHPSCLHGPYADIDPRIAKNWLPFVEEAAPWPILLQQRPPLAISAMALPLAALVYAAWALRKGERRDSFIALSLLLLIACAIGLAQARALSFAALAAIPIASSGLAHLAQIRRLTPRLGGVLAGALASPAILLALLTAATPAQAGAAEKVVAGDCTRIANFVPLLDQPAGVVFADLNLDTHILAATHHAVAGGPYHRLGQAIFDAITAFGQSTDQAAAVLARNGANYVALCRWSALPNGAGPASLAHALLEGPAPAWATPLTAPGAPVAIFRVDRALLPRV